MHQEITQLLDSARKGDARAEAQLVDVVYPRLKQIAKKQMRGERAGHTLEATALVNEAYLELFKSGERSWENRTHFFAYASSVMRHILVHHARGKSTQKRGGDRLRVTLDDFFEENQNEEDLIALDEALVELSSLDKRQAKLVELRFFGGLTVQEIASVMELSTSSVNKQLRAARGWLFHFLKD